eukprot:1494505-Prymnesium_polylepis.1
MAAVASLEHSDADHLVSEALVERIVSDARRIALSRGGSSVTARDFHIASAAAHGFAEASNPAAELPEHYDE